MDFTKKLLFSLLTFSAASISFAHSVTCPPADVVKLVTFERAIDFDPSMNLWEAVSVPFMHDNVQWNVTFGMEFPGVTDAAEALRKAQIAYRDKPLLNQFPEPIDIPGHVFCDYTEEDMSYWIQALSPPGE